MAVIIGDDTSGHYTWATLRKPLRETGAASVYESHNIEYLNGSAYHAGFRGPSQDLLRGSVYTTAALIEFYVGAGGNVYFRSNFFTGTGGNTENVCDESAAQALVGATLTLAGGSSFGINSDYKNTLNGQLLYTPPPLPYPFSSFDIDQISIMTSFDS